ncbi:glycosyltransferase family 4 protein [Phragmitibacter flavus]|nr:glycosyltransferase [Phragmitibacter flavus]
MQTAGIDVQIHTVPLPGRDHIAPPANAHTISKLTLPPEGSLIILCLDPQNVANLTDRVHPDFFTGRRYHVAVWFWELNAIPLSTIRASQNVDEVWVVTPFIRDAFARELTIPVRTFPHPIDPAILDSINPIKAPAVDGRFVFLFSFAYDSYGPRKNPEAICRAFASAFPEPTEDGPVLIIKSSKSNETWVMNHTRMVTEWSHRPDIYFIDGVMTDQARLELVKRCDCYVSLHRSEGLGLTIMEAMALGKPCIATGFSGNLSFMNDENSALVPWVPTRDGLHAPPYNELPEAEWAEPDITAAAAAMHRIFRDPAYAQAIGRQAASDIRSIYSLQAVGEKLRSLIDSSPVPAAPGDEPHPGHRFSSPISDAVSIPTLTGNSIESCYAQATRALKAIKLEIQNRPPASPLSSPSGSNHQELATFLTQLVDVCQLSLTALKEKEKSLVTIVRDLNSLFGSIQIPALSDLDAETTEMLLTTSSSRPSTETFHTKAVRSLNAFKSDLKQRKNGQSSNSKISTEEAAAFLSQLTDSCHLALKAVKEKEESIMSAVRGIDARLILMEDQVSKLFPLVAALSKAQHSKSSDWERLGIEAPSY